MEAIFFPRNDYPNNIEICNHRLGKKMTFCDQTTQMPELVSEMLLPWFVSLSQTRHLKVGCDFWDNYNTSAPSGWWSCLSNYVRQQIADGVIYAGLYFSPNPYGDSSEAAVMSAWNRLLPWFISNFGRKPVAASFSSTDMTYKQYISSYLLSVLQDPPFENRNLDTDYGIGVGSPSNVPYSQSKYYPRLFNLRVLDWARQDNENYSYYIDYASDLIDEVLSLPNGGLVTNFSHWHDLLYLDYDWQTGQPISGRNDYAIDNGFKPYYNMLAQKNANNEIYFAGFGEAVAYLVYRESISKAVMYSPIGYENEKLVIRLEAKNVFNIDTDLLQIPISIKFSTIGTPLAGQTIRCNYNLISLGNNQYIVEIPYSEYASAVIEKVSK